jgi:hypothetical protein
VVATVARGLLVAAARPEAKEAAAIFSLKRTAQAAEAARALPEEAALAVCPSVSSPKENPPAIDGSDTKFILDAPGNAGLGGNAGSSGISANV